MEAEVFFKRDKSKKKSKKYVEETPVPDDFREQKVKKKKKKSTVSEDDGISQKSPKKFPDNQFPSDMDSEPPEKRKKKAKKVVNDENFNTSFSERSDDEARVEKLLKKKLDAINSPQRSVSFSKNLTSPTKNKVPSDPEVTRKAAKRKLLKAQDEDHRSPSYSDLSTHETHNEDPAEKADQKDKNDTSDPKAPKITIEDVLGWSKEDVQTLISRIQQHIPSNDTLNFHSRVKKLNWNQISFGEYSAEECLKKWLVIEKKVRGYRLLSEVVHDSFEWVSKPWQDFYRSAKKNRHPEMPKRPLSSYMLFYMAKKDKILEEHPGVDMLSLSKLVSQRYNALSEKKKRKYLKLAATLSEEYHEKMAKFLEAHPEEVPVKKSDVKKSSNPYSTLTKPKTPFKLFLEEKKKKIEETEDFDNIAFTQQVKEIWKNLNTKKKVCWIQWAQEGEKNYLDSIKEISSIYPEAPAPKHKSVLTKEEKVLLERSEGRPEKPPNSAYALFSRSMLKDPDFVLECQGQPKEKLRKISALWAKLDTKDKEVYVLKTKMLAEQYKLEYASFLESLPEDKRAEEIQRNKRKPKKPKTVEVDSKLKQLRLEDSFKNMKRKSGEQATTNQLEDEEDEDEEEEEEEEDESGEEMDLYKQGATSQSQDERAILKRILEQAPTEPPKMEKELYKQLHSWVDDEEVEQRWQKMSDKARKKYAWKLIDMKQAFLVSFDKFLQGLSPEEVKIYSAFRDKDRSKARPPSESSSSGSDVPAVNTSPSKKGADSDSSSDD